MTDSTYSTTELNHFRQLSNLWWDEKGPFRQLHLLNPLRIAFLKQHICHHFAIDDSKEKPFENLNILDIGCGGGILSEPLARLGANVTAIDMVEENIDVAKIHALQHNLNINYQFTSAEALLESNHTYDLVTSMEVLEHVENPSLFLESCKELTKPGGVLCLSTLNKTWQSYLFGIVIAEYILKWAPQGTHNWEKFMSPDTLILQLSELGLNTIHLKGIHFSLYTKTWLLSDNIDINYLLFATKPLNPSVA